MSNNITTYSLNISKQYNVARDLVFQAWTDPHKLRDWWRMDESWTVPIAEVDLRMGGKYRIGMQPADKDEPYVATGKFLEVIIPRRLVYTWNWEGQEDAETLVTVDFNELDNSSEITLYHENFVDAKKKEEHQEGWQGCLLQLEKLLG